MENQNNDPIRIRQYTPAQLQLFNPNDESLGLVNNVVEALRVRLDIAEQSLPGYYFMFGSVRIDINTDGSVENWPEDLYNDTLNLCIKIRSIQLDRNC
jgi:hypothetical protein